MKCKCLLAAVMAMVMLLGAVPFSVPAVSAAEMDLNDLNARYELNYKETQKDFTFSLAYDSMVHFSFQQKAHCAVYAAKTGKKLWSNSSQGEYEAKYKVYSFDLLLPKGQYILRVTKEGDPNSSVTFSATDNQCPFDADIELEPNNAKETATPLDMGVTYLAAIGESLNERDVYVYTSPSAHTGRLYLPKQFYEDQNMVYHVDEKGNKTVLSNKAMKQHNMTMNQELTTYLSKTYWDIPTKAGKNYIYIESATDAAYRYNLRVTGTEPVMIDEAPYIHAAVKYGEMHTVQVKATGTSVGYTWMFRDKGATAFQKSSVKGNVYSTTMTKERADRELYCLITDVYGSKTRTRSVTLSVYHYIAIEQQPQDATAHIGETVSTSVVANGAQTYEWYYKDPGSTTFTKSTVANDRHYSCVMERQKSGRQVYCVVTDCYGNSLRSDIATLSVTPPTITRQPKDCVANVGDEAFVYCEASGDGLTYQWYFKNVDMGSFAKSSVTTSTYSYMMTPEKSGRQVYCVVKNVVGATVKSDVVTLSMPKPKITQQPADCVVNVGDTVRAVCKASGDGITYQWYFKNVGMGSFAKSSVTTSTYSYVMTPEKSGRQVYCVAKDQYGQTVKSNAVTLRMPKPKFTKQPSNAVAPIGQTVKTSVTASGSKLTYQWYYKNPGATVFLKSSVTTPNYSYAMTAAKSGRQVYCVITDQYGQKVQSNTVKLSVPAKPKITKQPTSAFAAIGKTVSTSLTATGTGLKYQWYFKNADMTAFSKSSVTTPTYSYVMTAEKSGRQVYCVIRDQYGQKVQSNTVKLSVPAKPKITKQPTSVKAAIGKTASTSLTATGTGLKYQWYFKNADMTAFSKSSVTTPTYSYVMTAEKSGRQVYCIVTDQYGQKVQSNTVTMSR